jgi:hypothetical protein
MQFGQTRADANRTATGCEPMHLLLAIYSPMATAAPAMPPALHARDHVHGGLVDGRGSRNKLKLRAPLSCWQVHGSPTDILDQRDDEVC